MTFFCYNFSVLFFVRSVFPFVTPSHNFYLFLPSRGGMSAGGRWLGCFASQRDRAHLIPPPLSLPGGQQGGLKSNWQLAAMELTQGLFRVALIDNCK